LGGNLMDAAEQVPVNVSDVDKKRATAVIKRTDGRLLIRIRLHAMAIFFLGVGECVCCCCVHGFVLHERVRGDGAMARAKSLEVVSRYLAWMIRV
jgi:hypothetical protein